MELQFLRHGALGLEEQPQLLAPRSLRESGSRECGGSPQFSNLKALKKQPCKNQHKTLPLRSLHSIARNLTVKHIIMITIITNISTIIIHQCLS